MSEYTQGIASDGAAILEDGQPLTIEEILQKLRERDAAQAKLAAIGKLSPTDYDDREQLLGALLRILRGIDEGGE